MRLDSVKLIDLPKILDERGNLSYFENSNQIPFDINRVYWIYDVPGGEKRGGHAYRNMQEFIIALSGSFDVVLNDGRETKTFTLNRSYQGLYIPEMVWRQLDNFSTNSLAFIASDSNYDELSYIRDYQKYKLLNNGE